MKSETKGILEGARLGVFGKGGSGKSTAVVLLARALRNRRYDVCVLDADSTNVGLQHALGITEPPVSLLDFYGGMVFSGGIVTCPVDDPIPLANAEMSLEELPSDYYGESPQGILLLVAGKIGRMGPGAGCDGPIAKIARDFQLETSHGKGLMIVDFKAGFEDSARGVFTNLDWMIHIVDPTRASVGMAIDMNEMVKQVKAGVPPATEHLEDPRLVDLATRFFKYARVKGIFFVLNRVDSSETEDLLRESLGEQGIEPIGVIRDDPSIRRSWLEGRPLAAPVAQTDVDLLVETLEVALSSGMKSSVGAAVV